MDEAKSKPFPRCCKRRIPTRLTVLVALCLLLVCPDKTTAEGAIASAIERTRLKSHLRDVMAAIDAIGAAGIPTDDLMGRYPLVTTLGIHTYRQDGDIQFLNALYASSTTYFNTALATFDSDGDFLMERATWAGGAGGMEGVGFNALFALDMQSLSAVCLELNKPIEALFWYQGMKTVSQRLVTATYDNPAGYFFPYDNSTESTQKRYYAASALPVFFPDQFGNNFGVSVLRNYVLKSQEVGPEIPVHFVDWTMTGSPTAPVSAELLITSVLLLHALDWNGMDTEAERYAAVIREQLLRRPVGRDAYSPYLVFVLRSNAYRELFSHHHSIAILKALARISPIDPKKLSDLKLNIDIVTSFLDGQEVDEAIAEKAMRAVFVGISGLRSQWKQRTLFTPHHRSQIPGFDIYVATSQLFDDVIDRLHDVETRIAKEHCKEQGFSVSVVPVAEKIIHGQDAEFTVSASTIINDLSIRSIVITSQQGADTLMKSARPVVVKAGEPALTYQARRSVYQQVPGSVRTLRFTIEVTLEGGKRLRFHQTQGVYIVAPIVFNLAYPEGRGGRGSVVPIDVLITKNIYEAALISIQWYSPAGLTLQEGPTNDVVIPAGTKNLSMRLNVVIPTPSRPGAFPFTMKLFANNEDGGTLTSTFFRHYEWIYVGPFSKKKDGLSAAQGPELGIDLRQSFDGASGPIQWTSLPQTTHRENGDIDLSKIISNKSVNYLYTVIKTEWETSTTISFASATPATLFLNGAETMRILESETGMMKRLDVKLQRGLNNFLLKVVSGDSETIFFQVGNPDDHAADAFNNNLWELVDGYHEFRERETTLSTAVEAQKIVTLTFSDPEANTVAVIGTFNGWSPVSSSMRRNAQGRWEISLHLSPGRYAYRFIVNNSQHVVDPTNGLQEPDGYGGINSVLFVD